MSVLGVLAYFGLWGPGSTWLGLYVQDTCICALGAKLTLLLGLASVARGTSRRSLWCWNTDVTVPRAHWRIGSSQVGLVCPVSLGWDHVGPCGSFGVNVMAAQALMSSKLGNPYENS